MISVSNALEIILDTTQTKKISETVDIINATGRILFKNIISELNVPQKNNSAMDGYAVIYSDTAKASYKNPVTLSIISEIQAGANYSGDTIKPGNAIRIMTGAPVPDGADAVVPFEDTEEYQGLVKIFNSFEKHKNIRFAGEDIKKGDLVVKKGTRIDSAEAGLIASLNIDKIEVYKKPEVAIIATGDEIIELGSINKTGQIVNSNAYTLHSEIIKYGGSPVYMGIAKDNIAETTEKIKEAMKYDIIITSGGVSMGKYDFVPDVLKSLGVEIKIEKVLMRPGKPVVFGNIGTKLFFGLPGNPVSVMVSFMQFVRPALLKMSGAYKLKKPVIGAKLLEEIRDRSGRKHFIRGVYSIIDNEFHVKTTGDQGSGILTSMSDANCLIILPANIENVSPGEIVEIQLINHGEI